MTDFVWIQRGTKVTYAVDITGAPLWSGLRLREVTAREKRIRADDPYIPPMIWAQGVIIDIDAKFGCFTVKQEVNPQGLHPPVWHWVLPTTDERREAFSAPGFIRPLPKTDYPCPEECSNV